MNDGLGYRTQQFIGELNDIVAGGVRVSYWVSAYNPDIVQDNKAVLYGYTNKEDLEVQTNGLFDLDRLTFGVRLFPISNQAKVWDSHDGKIVVIAFIDSITENIIKTLEQWDSSFDHRFEFYVLVFQKKAKLPNFNNIHVKKGTKDHEELFHVANYPHLTILQNSHEVFSGEFENFSLAKFGQMLDEYPLLETLQIYKGHAPEDLEIFNEKIQENKIIPLKGLTVIDFYLPNMIEIVKTEKIKENSIKVLQIYAGEENQKGTAKYSLSGKGINHSTAKKLQIIEFPTTIICNNTGILWKGNRQFVNFDSILDSIIEKTEINSKNEQKLEDIVFCALEELEKEKVEGFEKIRVDLKIFIEYDVTIEKVYPSKYRINIVAYCQDEFQENLIKNLAENLKEKLPMVTYELIKSHNVFSGLLTELHESLEPLVKPQTIFSEPKVDASKITRMKE